MKELFPLTGIVTVLNTPFTQGDGIDFPGLRRHVALAIKEGVAGFMVPALASEVYKLTQKERRDIVACVLEEVNGKVPVFGGAGETDASARQNIVRDLINLGCRNVLLQIPFESPEQYRRDLFTVADMDVETIMLQDWDARGYGLPVPLIVELFDSVPSFRCLKIETVPAGVKYSEVFQATAGRLHVSGGWAVMQMLEGLARGVHAFMPTGLHAIYTRIFRLYKSGQIEQARELFEKLLPIIAFANQHLDISIHFFKRLLHRQGVYATDRVRPPILPFDAVHEQIAATLIERAIALNERCMPSGSLEK